MVDNNDVEVSENIGERAKRDMEYIKSEVIAQQVDGSYCKWSRDLNAVAVVGITYRQYVKFWERQYKDYPEYIRDIVDTCMEKLDNGCISRQQMAQMIANSNDFKSEKEKAIKALGGVYIEDEQ